MKHTRSALLAFAAAGLLSAGPVYAKANPREMGHNPGRALDCSRPGIANAILRNFMPFVCYQP